MADVLEHLTDADRALVVLAMAARARVGALEGAAVRDADGQAHAAATVVLPSLTLTALQAAVVGAVSAGAVRFEVAVVVTEGSAVDAVGLAAVRDVSAGAPLHVVDPAGGWMGTMR